MALENGQRRQRASGGADASSPSGNLGTMHGIRENVVADSGVLHENFHPDPFPRYGYGSVLASGASMNVSS